MIPHMHHRARRTPARTEGPRQLGATLVAVAALLGACTNAASDARPAVAASTPGAITTSTPTAGSTTATPTPSPTSTTPTNPSPTNTPSVSPAVATPALMAQGAQSPQVRELQARLAQLGHFKSTPSGIFGALTLAGVKAFQESQTLPVTGEVDQLTWERLLGASRQPTARELDPPMLAQGATGAKVRELQARLKQLDLWSGDVTSSYGATTTSAVKSFQTKRGLPVSGEVDSATWAKLTSVTRAPTSYELANITAEQEAAAAAAGLDARCLTGRVLCASKAARKLYWVIDGKVQLTLDARFGRSGYPTDNGLFHVYTKDRDSWSNLYDVKMPFSLYYNGGEAVHYSADFAARGYNGGSHGCVNIRDWSRMSWLFDQVRVGDTVVVY